MSKIISYHAAVCGYYNKIYIPLIRGVPIRYSDNQYIGYIKLTNTDANMASCSSQFNIV